jgi:hypothetical protein
MRIFATAWAVIMACLCGPSIASADSGSITNVTTLSNGQVQASYTATGTSCETSGFCSYFPYAVEVAAAEACRPYYNASEGGTESGSRLTWVGEVRSQFQTQSGSYPFYPDSDPVRICLYVRGTQRPHVLVAQYVHNVRTAPPATTPQPSTPTSPSPTPTSPSPQVDTVSPLSSSEARASVPRILKKKFGSRFNRSSLTRSCYRLTSEKVRCNVVWRKKPFRYVGKVTMWNDPADPANSMLFTVSVRRKRTATASVTSSDLTAQADALRSHLLTARLGRLNKTRASSLTAVASKSCSSGWKRAVINGSHKCLRRGQFCARGADRQYHRYGYHCHKQDSRGNYHLS